MSTPPVARRRAALAAAAVVVVVLVAAVGVWTMRSNGDPVTKRVAGPEPKVTAAAATAATATPSPGSTAPSTPTPRPTRTVPLVPHEFVAAAAPTRFVYRSPRYTVRAQVCGMENVRPLDPPGEQHHTVCWVQHDFGYAPGSRGRGTTYVLGHSWAEDSNEVLNPLSEAAMRQVRRLTAQNRSTAIGGVPTYTVTALDGDTITLRTSTGTLTYSVRHAYAVAKADAGNVPTLMDEHTRNRVVIITCGELGGVDYDDNIIVEAYLTSSSAARA